MIKIFEEDNDIINVSIDYVESAIKLYLKTNIIDAVFNYVKLKTSDHNNTTEYSVVLKIDSKKSQINFKKMEWYMENIKFYILTNFNLNCIVTIGLN